MIINGRQVVLKPEFDEMLDEMLEWFISQGNEQFAKQFVRGLYNDIVHKIAPPRPESHSEYAWKQTPQRLYRRYVFRKKYHVMYKVLPQKLEFLAIVYSRRDFSKIPIE